MKLFTKRGAEDEGLHELEQGVKTFQKGMQDEEDKLKDLFVSLKTDLIDEFLIPGNGHIKHQHLQILEEQVRHVVSVARAVGYKELVASLEEEHKVISNLRTLIEDFPDVSIDSSPDLRATLEKLRRLLNAQQHMIFAHEEILLEEKKRVVDILNQVKGLKQDRERDLNMKDAIPGTSQDNQSQYS